MKLTKEQKQLIVIVVGLVVLAVVFFFNLRKKDDDSVSEKVAASAEQKVAPAEVSRPKISSDIRSKQVASLNKPYGRDPFTLASRGTKIEDPEVAGPKLTPGSMSLRAISVREGAAPMAVINNSITRIGDKIGDVEVVGIYKNYVLLKKGGKEYKLELEE